MFKVYFVGCGPGDPDLLTIKAKKLIQKADVLIYSGSLIPPLILKLCKKIIKNTLSDIILQNDIDVAALSSN